MAALCSLFCALLLSCCLISTALCRQFQASDVGCFIDSTNGVREFSGLKYLGLTRVGSYSVWQASDAGSFGFVGSQQMTHELCGSVCALGGFQFMALQSIKWCACGNSYGTQGAAPDAECSWACSGNSAQNCGGDHRNRVFRLNYASEQNLFVKGNRTLVAINQPDSPAFSTVSAAVPIQCVARCRAGCEAVIFSLQQRLCHLLEYAVVPTALSSPSSGETFFIRA